MLISDWSSDVCSSDLKIYSEAQKIGNKPKNVKERDIMFEWSVQNSFEIALTAAVLVVGAMFLEACWRAATDDLIASDKWIKSELSAIKDEEIRTLLKELLIRSEEHPSELQSLM